MSEQNQQGQPPKKIKDVLPQFIIFILIVSIFVFGSTYITRFLETTDKVEVEKIVNEIIKEKEVIIRKPKCEHSYQSYLELKGKGQSVRLVDNKSSYAKNGNFVGDITPTVFISGKDEIACGYLYLKISKNNKPIDKKYDSIYINPRGFGGHILRERGIILNEKDNFTEVLVPLKTIYYISGIPYNPDAQNFKVADWVNLLNVNSHLNFDIGLSTLDKGGKINDITIVYKCWDEETGKESNNCQLSIDE
jgi:hypothetical protein